MLYKLQPKDAIIIYELSRTCNYNNKEYTVVEVLNNDLILAIPVEDIKNGAFPITPVVIPDVEIIEKRKTMK